MVEICKLDICIVESGSLLSRLNPFHKSLWQWQAEATGPNGTYLAAWSSAFRAMGDHRLGPRAFGGAIPEASEDARKEVLSILLREGWIPMDNRQLGQTFTRELTRGSSTQE